MCSDRVPPVKKKKKKKKNPRGVNPAVIPLAMLIHGVNPLREPEASDPFPLWLTGRFCRQSGSPPLVLLSGQGANLRNPLTARSCRNQESNRRHEDTDSNLGRTTWQTGQVSTATVPTQIRTPDLTRARS
jgi:hypothetical protein